MYYQGTSIVPILSFMSNLLTVLPITSLVLQDTRLCPAVVLTVKVECSAHAYQAGM